MICRGGVVVGGWGDIAPDAPAAPVAAPHPLEFLAARRGVRWSAVLGSVLLLTLLLSLLHGRASIAPLVESDYCYQLMAAERFAAGQGLTATQPVAPFVPWQWRYDWGFLTQWPAGYPLLVAAVRRIAGGSTLDACRRIAVVACAAALVGWFVWIRRCVPRGLTGVLLAAVGASSAVTVGSLVNPSTDAILVAAVPYVLLGVGESRRIAGETTAPPAVRRTTALAAVAGLLAGGLFWIRYASVFVPAALGLFFLWEWIGRKPASLRGLTTFLASAALPIAALLILNRALGDASSAAEQLNLGSRIGFDFSFSRIARAWWMFTDLGYYDHRPIAHRVLAVGPIALMVIAMTIRPIRNEVATLLRTPGFRLGACLPATLLLMLVSATTLFGAKFDYVGLDRYYLPVKPLYCLLFVSPLMLIPRRIARAALCLAMLAAASWTVRQDWSRTYARWASADRPVTPSGAWSRCFEPGARELYEWLRTQNSRDLVVVSNYHEFVAFETGVATLPIPPDRESLAAWLARIAAARGIARPRVLFVLDSDNRWRSHWITPPAEVISAFDLRPSDAAPEPIRGYVLEWHG